MTRFSRSFNGCKIQMPAVVAKASRAAIRATPAAHVKTPCLRREMFHSVRAYAATLHSVKSPEAAPWSTPLTGPVTMAIFTPKTIALINWAQTNDQDSSCVLELCRTASPGIQTTRFSNGNLRRAVSFRMHLPCLRFDLVGHGADYRLIGACISPVIVPLQVIGSTSSVHTSFPG